jgi:hypothetical protein
MRQNFDAEKAMESVDFDRYEPHPYLAKNASYLSFYGSQHGLWEAATVVLKLEAETREAILYDNVESKIEGKATENAKKAKVAQDEELQKIKKQLAFAKGQETMYKNQINALNAAGNNARTIESSLRGERAR